MAQFINPSFAYRAQPVDLSKISSPKPSSHLWLWYLTRAMVLTNVALPFNGELFNLWKLFPSKSFYRPYLWCLIGTMAISGIGVYSLFYLQSESRLGLNIYKEDAGLKATGQMAGGLALRLRDDEADAKLLSAKLEKLRQWEKAAYAEISRLESQISNAKLTLQQSERLTAVKIAKAQEQFLNTQDTLIEEQSRQEDARDLLIQKQMDLNRLLLLAHIVPEIKPRIKQAQIEVYTALVASQNRQKSTQTALLAAKVAQIKLAQAREVILNPTNYRKSYTSQLQAHIDYLQVQLQRQWMMLLKIQADIKALNNQKLG